MGKLHQNLFSTFAWFYSEQQFETETVNHPCSELKMIHRALGKTTPVRVDPVSDLDEAVDFFYDDDEDYDSDAIQKQSTEKGWCQRFRSHQDLSLERRICLCYNLVL